MHRTIQLIAVLAFLAMCGCSKSAKLERHTARGDEYYQQRAYANAEVEYLNALRLAPANPAIIRKLATVYFEQGRTLATAGALSEVLRSTPQDIMAHQQLSSTLLIIGDVPGARHHALIVVTNQPTNFVALLAVAETASTSTQLVDSAKIIDDVLKKAPLPGVYIASASLKMRQGQLAPAEEQLRKATALSNATPELDLAWAKLRLVQTNLLEAEVLLKRAATAAPDISPIKLSWIDFEIARGNLASAKQAAEELTDKVSEYIPPWTRLAGIALAESRFEDCESISKRILGLDSRSHEALLLRSKMWSAQAQFGKAIEELTRLESLLPKSPAVKYELAAAHARSSDPSKAMSFVNSALSLDPRFPQAIILQARLNLQAGNAGAANTALIDLVRNRPELREANLLLAASFVTLKRMDDAIAVYRSATARYPKDAETPVFLGLALLSKGDNAGARSAFEQSLQRSSNNIPAIEQLVNLDIRATNFPAALARSRQVQNTFTNSAAGFVFEAQVYQAQKNGGAAETALTKALQREPRSQNAIGALIDLYLQSGNTNRAMATLDKLIEVQTNAFAAWTQKGMIYESRGETAKAIDAYERTLAINKNAHIALNNLANLYAQSPQKLNEAVALATRAAEVAPEDPSIADTLGWLLYQKRDYTAARIRLNQAAQKLEHPEVLYHAGMADYAVGDENGARQWFTKALAMESLPAKLRQDAQARLAVVNAQPANLAALEEAAKRDPNDYLAQFKLGNAYQLAGSREKAITAFKAAAKNNPQSAQPLVALSRLYSGVDDKAAIEFARTARKMVPNDLAIAATLGAASVRVGDYAFGYSLLLDAQRAGALTVPSEQYQFAIVQVALGRTAEALALLNNLAANAPAQIQKSSREAVTLLTGDAAAKTPLAEARLNANQNDLLALIAAADLASAKGDAKNAVNLYQKVLAVAPGYTPAHQRLAALYVDGLKDGKAAYSHALKAREAAPNDPQVARILGKIALEDRKYSDALRFAEEASRGLSNDGEPYYLIGAAQLSLKRTNEAKIALTKAGTLPLKPETTEATKRLLSTIK